MSESLNLLDNQRFALMKFRRVMTSSLQPHHDDYFLLRWLKARNWDVEGAEKMLRNSLQWRKQWEVDKIEEYNEPEVMKKYTPHGICGYDKEGSPVVVITFGEFDIYGLLHVTTKKEIIKTMVKYLEYYLKMCNEQVKKHGHLAGKITVIYDLEGFNLKPYLWRPATETIISSLQIYEANYPEILKMCFLINAPKMFSFAFSIAKKFLNDYTISKLKMFKPDPTKWGPAILELISPDQIPAYYGGTLKDPDGNPRLRTKLCLGGKIPKEMYLDKVVESDESLEYTTVNIRKGDKIKLSLDSSEEGSVLSWDFRTEDYDIKFGILKEDASGIKTEVVPITRIDAHILNETGVLTCEKLAKYFVIFDNTYSIMKNKKIHYCIRMLPPSEEFKTTNAIE
ncbi:PREDICTED: SEC14-like protein 2 [Polistes canadensis]|uniref:SEC14-like protein 2 n=1 Tax=Polistes canadensis TaxID=91411 RepID=UPI000718EC08|nr:PREDICTED: SEC14-like protein 2 [Polistes canadensis]XP_014615122.1 PREDICTED: SEC14-like protein 2 [Polistes canadensis]XP_014615123.1 PREDICTED: SEC14-like protein 2 [Polistes canadensis]